MDLNMFNQIAQINDHLFLSSAGAIKQDRIRTLGITHIVNCTMEIPNLRLPSLECIQIHVEDTPSARLGMYFDRCADKIHHVHKSGGKTLVHCVAGVSRSASLCIAYLMKYQRMTLDQAYYHVKKRRPVIRPNVGFWRQLIEYERRLFGRNTVKMIPSGIGPIPDVYKEETKNMVWFSPRTSSYSSASRSQNYDHMNTYNTTYSRSYNTLPFRHGYWVSHRIFIQLMLSLLVLSSLTTTVCCKMFRALWSSVCFDFQLYLLFFRRFISFWFYSENEPLAFFRMERFQVLDCSDMTFVPVENLVVYKPTKRLTDLQLFRNI